MIYSILESTVEFVKNYFLTAMFMKYMGKKRVAISYLLMVISMVIICFIDRNDDWRNTLSSIVVMITLMLASDSYKNISITFLSYAVISSIDIFLSVYFIMFWNLNMNELTNSKLYVIGFNLITLLGVAVVYIFYSRKYKGRIIRLSLQLYIITAVCAMIVALFSSLLQFRAADYWADKYNNLFIVAFNTISLIMFIVLILMFIYFRKNAILKIENQKEQELLIAQEKYYKLMLDKEEETKAFRHDIMNHLYCMKLLLEQEKYEQLCKYMSELIGNVQDLSSEIKTGNELINAIIMNIINDYIGVYIDWEGVIPSCLSVSQPELCTIFYNLIRNAAEAVVDEDDKRIVVKVTIINNMLSIVMKNHCSEPLIEDGILQTHKSEPEHGYGVKNVKKIIEKNNGELITEYSKGLFIVDILLPIN